MDGLAAAMKAGEDEAATLVTLLLTGNHEQVVAEIDHMVRNHPLKAAMAISHLVTLAASMVQAEAFETGSDPLAMWQMIRASLAGRPDIKIEGENDV